MRTTRKYFFHIHKNKTPEHIFVIDLSKTEIDLKILETL